MGRLSMHTTQAGVGGPRDGILLGKSAGSAPVELVMKTSGVSGDTRENDWWTDITGFQEDVARRGAWDTTNPETSTAENGDWAEMTGSRGAPAQVGAWDGTSPESFYTT
jgi:hypothetical protein